MKAEMHNFIPLLNLLGNLSESRATEHCSSAHTVTLGMEQKWHQELLAEALQSICSFRNETNDVFKTQL